MRGVDTHLSYRVYVHIDKVGCGHGGVGLDIDGELAEVESVHLLQTRDTESAGTDEELGVLTRPTGDDECLVGRGLDVRDNNQKEQQQGHHNDCNNS